MRRELGLFAGTFTTQLLIVIVSLFLFIYFFRWQDAAEAGDARRL